MLTKEEVRKKLEGYQMTYVARQTGLSIIAVRGVMKGISKRPSANTLDKMREFCARLEER